MKRLIFAFLLGACASHAPGAMVSAEPVVVAERAFAADAAERGWVAAFRSYAALDATQLGPDPVNAHDALAQIEGDGSTNLAWGPSWAGIAQSGEFGFTTGPFWSRTREGVRGHYFTVWRKQPDGSWRWIFDGGTEVTATARARESGPIPMLAPSGRGVGSAAAAVEQVGMWESQIANGDALASEALANHLAVDAHVNRAGAASATGPEAGALARAGRGVSFLAPVRVEASSAGDMVFTLGEARWLVGETPTHGFYARIWQYRLEGWRIVFDELIARREG